MTSDSQALRIFRFQRSMNGKLNIGSGTGYYSNEGENFSFSLLYGVTSNAGNRIDGNLGTASLNTSTGMNGSSDFINLFEMYRITRIDMEFLPAFNTSQGIKNPNDFYPTPMIWFALDEVDSFDVPASMSDITQRENIRVYRLDKPLKLSFPVKPIVSVADNQVGGISTAATYFGKDMWTDCQLAGSPYAGLKFWVDNATGGLQPDNYPVIFRACFHIECRGVH
jgi:hypothetical protein